MATVTARYVFFMDSSPRCRTLHWKVGPGPGSVVDREWGGQQADRYLSTQPLLTMLHEANANDVFLHQFLPCLARIFHTIRREVV